MANYESKYTGAEIDGQLDKVTSLDTEMSKKVNKTTTVNGKALSGNVTLEKGDIGLGNVDNTSDLNKPISTATQTALDQKVAKVTGKQLSKNDYTDTDKAKVTNLFDNTKQSINDEITARKLGTNEYNVSILYPTSGVTSSGANGGNLYSLETASAKIGTNIKKGQVLAFYDKDNNGETTKYEYNGTDYIHINIFTNEEKRKLYFVSYLPVWYGIEWDITISNPLCTRIGNLDLHKSLPIQNKMRRCLLLDNGNVNYYLSDLDSTKKEDGTNATLDGTDGQVMVEIPEFWMRFESEGNKRRCKISEIELDGFIHYPKCYVSAYEATVQRSTNKLSSVVNLTADYRGGTNSSSWDNLSKSLLGKPATNINLNNFRTYARNRGSVNWNCYVYNIHKELCWLFFVEYANFNSQAPFNSELTSEGYKQGGLGFGVTILEGSKWIPFNTLNPVIPCGITNSLGNKSGNTDYNMPSEYDVTTTTVQVPSYHGVENPFGHLWKWTDGCKCLIQSNADGGLSEFYVCDKPSDFTNSGVANYTKRCNVVSKEGYIKAICTGENGDIMPSKVGGSSSSYFCDYYYTSKPESGTSERGVLIGGYSSSLEVAGYACSYTGHDAIDVAASFGSRLCYIN